MSLYCRNCGHADSVVLLVDLATELPTRDRPRGQRADGRERTAPPYGTRRPTDWSLDVACPACSSTDLAGDPRGLFAELAR